MLATDSEIDRMARELIARHGSRAARVAAERLNEMLDRGNVRGRDIWACVVRVIHERLGTGPARSGTPDPWSGALRFDCTDFAAAPGAQLLV